MTTDPDLFSVGWICALMTEYVAAQAFLDEKYGSPDSISTHDNNNYILGRIGRHNVVIAVLPDGEYGLASAAVVARDMLHSFPQIRIGLMVGIGGGAPTRSNDIRLGDVVVSRSSGGYGGVFQYDFGKTIQDKAFQTTQFLNQPPHVLRTAVSGLKAEHEMDGHDIDTAINDVFQKFPRLRKKYARPENDTLFKSDFIHMEKDENPDCMKCGNNSDRIEQRNDRDEEDKIVIHYGLVASANNLMKDAVLRDKLAAEKGVLCFEMEAAGLVNHFPCIVVRGICDYADSHKNKKWQGYAAMTAAAYAKQLLLQIIPNKLEAERKIRDILSQVNEATEQIATKVAHIDSRQRGDAERKILDWITPIDYGKKQSDYFNRHHPGTGQWLLESDDYHNWINSKGSTLFCPGIPGAGKTILTSIIINDILVRTRDQGDVAVVWIYCNFRESQDQQVTDLLATILKQLSQIPSELPSSVRELYNLHNQRRTVPSIEELSKSIQSVALLYSRVFVFVDALDECQTTDSCRNIFLQRIGSLQAKSNINLFLTSRYNPMISDRVAEYQSVIVKEIRATEQDVRSYIGSLLPKLQSFVERNTELQMEIISSITKIVDGMFLLAKLHCDSLQNCTTQKMLHAKIDNFGKGADAYSSAYTDAMERIQGQTLEFQQLANEALSWITFARRPLTVRELQHALAIELDTEELDEANIPELDLIISVCAGLVTIDDESGIIRLVHYTTQEFFQRTGSKWFPNGQTSISKKMLTYLSYETFRNGSAKSDAALEERLQVNALYEYASKSWGYHARDATNVTPVNYARFLENNHCTMASSQVLLSSTSKYLNYSQRHLGLLGLHLAAFFGVQEALQVLLDKGFDFQSRDESERTPLFYASENHHTYSVKLLLAAGAESNSQDILERTPLFYAVKGGYIDIVKLLLAAGAEVNSQDILKLTPLFYAVKGGYIDIIKLLLAAGAEVNSQDIWEQAPLCYTVEGGDIDIVKLLLAAGAEVNSQDIWEQTPLCYTVEGGDIDIVKLLLAARAEVNSRDERKRTPLFYAAKGGCVDIVKLLLTAGAEVNIWDYDGMTPLTLAVELGYEDVTRLLFKARR